jgi:hypothetical protein
MKATFCNEKREAVSEWSSRIMNATEVVKQQQLSRSERAATFVIAETSNARKEAAGQR